MASQEIHPDTLFASILSDHTSGSGVILQKCMNLIKLMSHHASRPSREYTLQLRSMLERMKDAFPSFAIVHHFADQCFRFLENNVMGFKKDSFLVFLREYRQHWRDAGTRLTDRFLEEVDLRQKTLLLHSQSGTVQDVLARCDRSKHPALVYQTESRPAMEGRIQAAKINLMGIPVVVMTDSAVARIVREVDYFLSGADWIAGTAFINKTGTRSIAMLCHEEQKPCYVLADSRKYRPVEGDIKKILDTDHGPQELRGKLPEGIRVVNLFFEDIPLEYISRFFRE